MMAFLEAYQEEVLTNVSMLAPYEPSECVCSSYT